MTRLSWSRMSNKTVYIFVWLVAFSRAQEQSVVGVDICACQPSAYTITLNFGLECDDRDIDGNIVGGVQETACVVEGAVKDVEPTDPFPVSVSEISFTELDQALQPVKQDILTDSFVDGAVVTYTSFTTTEPENVNSDTLPSGMQVELTGANAAGELVKNAYVILFNKNCSVYPVLTDGMQIGWTVFTAVTAPPATVCPLSIEDALNVTSSSDFPSTAPSLAPSTRLEISDFPSTAPSGSPVQLESDLPSLTPTGVPSVFALSDFPSLTPSTAPSGMVSLTAAPSTSPPSTTTPTTVAPSTLTPTTSAPSIALETLSPTQQPTSPAPTESPTVAPTDPPSDPPVEPPEECEEYEKDDGKGKGKGKGKGTKASDIEEDEDDEEEDDDDNGGKGKGKGRKKKKKCKKKKGKGKGKGLDDGKGKKEKKRKKQDERRPSDKDSKTKKGKRTKKSKSHDDDSESKKHKIKKEGVNSDKRARKHNKDDDHTASSDRRLRRITAPV